jgi:hypothetical protein
MKAGSLVNIVDPARGIAWASNHAGKSGIVLSKYQHVTATCGKKWYTVLVEGIPRAFREDYLVAF